MNFVKLILLFVFSYCLACYTLIAIKGGTPEYGIACWVSHGIFGLIFYASGGWVVWREMKKW